MDDGSFKTWGEVPGDNRKVYGFGLVDWRGGWFDGRIATILIASVLKNSPCSFHRGKSIDWSGAPTTTVEPPGRSVFMAANAISLPISAAVGSAPLLVRR
jgi:hypothetical protein